MTRGAPPVQLMVAHYLGYKMNEEEPARKETMDEASERLVQGLFGMRR